MLTGTTQQGGAPPQTGCGTIVSPGHGHKICQVTSGESPLPWKPPPLRACCHGNDPPKWGCNTLRAVTMATPSLNAPRQSTSETWQLTTIFIFRHLFCKMTQTTIFVIFTFSHFWYPCPHAHLLCEFQIYILITLWVECTWGILSAKNRYQTLQ